jgi:hypothetical protein
MYYERVERQHFRWQDILELPKIQCATLLVRAFECPVDNRNRNLNLEKYSKLTKD